MTDPTLWLLVGFLVVFMGTFIHCGFRARYLRFFAVTLSGLALNLCWMVFGLKAHPFEVHVWVAQASATLYAVCAFAVGWFAARIRRAWRDAQISGPTV